MEKNRDLTTNWRFWWSKSHKCVHRYKYLLGRQTFVSSLCVLSGPRKRQVDLILNKNELPDPRLYLPSNMAQNEKVM